MKKLNRILDMVVLPPPLDDAVLSLGQHNLLLLNDGRLVEKFIVE